MNDLAENIATLTKLAAEHGCHLTLVHDDVHAPQPWALWSDWGTDDADIVGSGESVSEAYADALEHVLGWGSP